MTQHQIQRVAPSPPGAAASDSTAARLSKSRSPFLVIRWTSTSSAARNAATAAWARSTGTATVDPPAAGLQHSDSAAPGDSDHLDHVEAVRQRLVESGVDRGRVDHLGQRRARGTPPRWPTRWATAPAYEIRGCGLKPDEYAIGNRARNTARSKARLKSRWLVNRSRPRLA